MFPRVLELITGVFISFFIIIRFVTSVGFKSPFLVVRCFFFEKMPAKLLHSSNVWPLFE